MKDCENLGRTIESNMKFDIYTQLVKAKVCKGMVILARLKGTSSIGLRKQIYRSLLESQLTNMLAIYARTYKTMLDLLIRIQERAICPTCVAPETEPIANLFRACNTMSLAARYVFSVGALRYFEKSLLIRLDQRYPTRFVTAGNITIPRLTKATSANSVKIFNGLPTDSEGILM